MRERWLLVVIVLAGIPLVAAQTIGRITGIVLDEHGQALGRVTVCTSVTSGNSRAIGCRIVSDTDGRFQIQKVRFGEYGVFAISEGEGYSIDNQSPGQKVTVSAESSAPDVTIRMRRKGGILVGTIRDKMSGAPIGSASVQYIALDGTGGGSARVDGGEFQIAAPADNELVILVSAKGYKGWVYTDASNPTRPVLKLGSGERKVLDLELEPLTK